MATLAIPSSAPGSSQTAAAVRSSSAPGRSSSATGLDGRFPPGAVLGGRYQIVGLLGRGGMGEVYRANDLTLGQAVALKFLPEAMAQNPAMLARFHGEVRIARQVSHPNVCRVHDIGEAGGQLFLSMEYIDGEDLGSLLRRIGRLPADKAVEFARKICAGLAAAHGKGVLHRDLKPANIMVDGRGEVVLMDFGLAGVSGELRDAEIQAGTPAYMAPEQLAGREVTIKSDIYALGLVLYEMFAGRRPFEGNSLAEMMRRQELSQPASISTLVKDLDPAVERVILRCLDPAPGKRPTSALAVAAALPGGDPLAAALAAGETPSPDLVAASGAKEGMRPLYGILCFAAVLILTGVCVATGDTAQLLGNIPLELPPDALALKARQAIERFGYTDKPADTALGFYYDSEYLRYLHDKPPAHKLEQLRSGTPPAVVFWYRQSPRPLNVHARAGQGVTLSDPPPVIAGMKEVRLAPSGHLLEFRAVTNQVDDRLAAPGPVDWGAVFEAAGLPMSQFQEAQPEWLPASMADERKAWKGQLPGPGKEAVRLEAAAFRGRIVYAEVVGSWTRPARMQAYQPTVAENAVRLTLITLLLGVSVGVSALAYYNRKSGRGDNRGALRAGLAGGAMSFLVWLLAGKHVTNSNEVLVLFDNIAWSLLWSAGIWTAYTAIEPYVRRHWPQAIISWSRLLGGAWRDPLVGRDVLIGTLVGVGLASLVYVSSVIEIANGGSPIRTAFLDSLLDARHGMALAVIAAPNALLQLLVLFFLLFVFRMLLRKPWLVALAFIVVYGGFSMIGSRNPAYDVPFALAYSVAIFFTLTRFGFVAFLAACYINVLFVLAPLTANSANWYFGTTAFVVILVLSMAAYGLHTALAGRSIIRDDLL